MFQIPRELGPEGSEVAVLSLLAVDSEGSKLIRAGSLLTYPNVAQGFSWKEWMERQPSTRGPRIPRNEPDLGASFEEEPFAGVHIYRSVLDAGEWLKTVNDLEAGKLNSQGETYWLQVPDWSACRLFCQLGESDSHHVLWEAQRPIRGVTTTTSGPEMPHVEGLWLKGSAAFKPSGQRSREEVIAGETFANWPIHLLGIWWPGTDETDAPHSFVVGEAQDGAWIADVVPEHDQGLLKIAIAWESSKTDPFSCSLLVQSELDGAALLVRNWRISDLPGEGAVKVVAAKELELETAARAAQRRVSTADELARYLKWRFSARSGELLVLDPYLLDGDEDDVERVVSFLCGLRRSIRALTAKAPAHGLAAFASASTIEVKGLPNGTDTLHDRFWLVGDTGVLTGASLNHFLREESAATTAVDLPFADSAIWREKFRGLVE